MSTYNWELIERLLHEVQNGAGHSFAPRPYAEQHAAGPGAGNLRRAGLQGSDRLAQGGSWRAFCRHLSSAKSWRTPSIFFSKRWRCSRLLVAIRSTSRWRAACSVRA